MADLDDPKGPGLMTVQRVISICAAMLIAVTTVSSAQAPAVQTPGDAAAQLLNIGQYDAVEGVLSSATDQRSFALRGRAHIARGRHAEAEKLLIGPAGTVPGGDAALELGLLYLKLGRRNDGSRVLQALIAASPRRTAADYHRIAEAARALGYFQDANDFIRNAARLAPTDPIIQTAWGDLFLEKHDEGEAATSYEQALNINAQYVPALIGLARVVASVNPPAARESLVKLLEINPNYVPAHLLVAELALDDRRHDDARSAIQKALEVNPASLDAMSLDAALAFLEARNADFDRIVAAVLALHPTYGEVHRVVGYHLGRSYRFDEAVDMTRKAVSLDPTNSRAFAELGSHLMRTGDEAAARTALETSFKADPYDQFTYNLLANLDVVDKFVTIREGDVIVKIAPAEAAVMREFLVPLAQEALTTLAKRYEFTPRVPILIEMFDKHDDFAVRTLGLPGFVGVLGACFGRVITLDSPAARPPGQFNWATTLWHEMAHVITLQMSGNRLPRWLSEGVSVYEERRARAEWGREMEVSFAQMMDADKVFTLRALAVNEGFTDPRMISLAYYQSSLVVEHIVARFGEPGLRRFITAFGRGLDTPEAMQDALGTSIDDLQTTFTRFTEQQFAPLRAALKSPDLSTDPSLEDLKKLATDNAGSFYVQLALANKLHEEGDAAGAIAAAERAFKLIPQMNGEDNPNALIALIAIEENTPPRAIQALEELVKVDTFDVESARRLAFLVQREGDQARALAASERVAELDPFDVAAQTAVGRAALQRGEAAKAVRHLRAALAGNPTDRATAHTELAEAHLAAGQRAEARTQVLNALEIAPAFERAQGVLLKIIETP
jgi:tetratricopeptide (TPR) repeat protein